MTEEQLQIVADGDRAKSVADLASMYEISNTLAERIVAVAEPHARFATLLVDRAFVHLVRSHEAYDGHDPTTVELLGFLFDAVLIAAVEKEDSAACVNEGLKLLGCGSESASFPKGPNYLRAIPAMRMILPRLIEIQLTKSE